MMQQHLFVFQLKGKNELKVRLRHDYPENKCEELTGSELRLFLFLSTLFVRFYYLSNYLFIFHKTHLREKIAKNL